MNAITSLFCTAGIAALVAAAALQPAQANTPVQLKTVTVTGVGPAGELTINGRTYHVLHNPQNDGVLKSLHEGDQVDVNLNIPSAKSSPTVNFIKIHPAPAQ